MLGWWELARAERDLLPWRATRDPWAILLAETMLVQTQAPRAALRYREVLERFPTPRACAAAPAGEVIRSWEGLGYNRRAVMLHRAACEIVEHHGGAVPRTLPELLALPGVGPYTARAVLSTAFGSEAAVVDTNVGRVLARALEGAPLRPAAAQRLADSLVPAGRAREWNLALMDFGSLVCRAARPRCDSCDVGRAGQCAWRRAGAGAGPADPARGSAGVTARQARFAGSDRQGRGRIVDALRRGPVAPDVLAAAAGWPDDPGRARRVVHGLVGDGVVVVGADGAYRLP
ncbi:MAG TPA: A/G-specific adenine glycosylase [Acidimicrobiales bacterium]|nr:A/G-specific adenine glycosylase [Acidimicrobiales bacterium]